MQMSVLMTLILFRRCLYQDKRNAQNSSVGVDPRAKQATSMELLKAG